MKGETNFSCNFKTLASRDEFCSIQSAKYVSQKFLSPCPSTLLHICKIFHARLTNRKNQHSRVVCLLSVCLSVCLSVYPSVYHLLCVNCLTACVSPQVCQSSVSALETSISPEKKLCAVTQNKQYIL